MREVVSVLLPDAGNGFDIGNTGANVATFNIPFKCAVVNFSVYSNTAVANSFTVSADSYDFSTQGAADVGNVVVPDSTGANRVVVDEAGQGVVLNAGSQVLVQVDEAGDSGEKGFCKLLIEHLPETPENQTLVTVTA
jgi:hypothetical protein